MTVLPLTDSALQSVLDSMKSKTTFKQQRKCVGGQSGPPYHNRENRPANLLRSRHSDSAEIRLQLIGYYYLIIGIYPCLPWSQSI